jgi:hypothetical protein
MIMMSDKAGVIPPDTNISDQALPFLRDLPPQKHICVIELASCSKIARTDYASPLTRHISVMFFPAFEVTPSDSPSTLLLSSGGNGHETAALLLHFQHMSSFSSILTNPGSSTRALLSSQAAGKVFRFNTWFAIPLRQGLDSKQENSRTCFHKVLSPCPLLSIHSDMICGLS